MSDAHWPSPPSFRDLAPGGHDDRPPRGALAPYCGPERISSDTTWKASFYSDEPARRPVADAVRAWLVPHLVDCVFAFEDSDQIDAGLLRGLRAAMPDIAWRPIQRSPRMTPDLPLGKYAILHTSVPTPPDETTGQPMSLELYGAVESVDGVSPEDTRSWMRQHAAPRFNRGDRPFVGRPLSVRIEQAIWANIAWTHVGIPFYL